MKVWNTKHDIDHEELEEKITELASKLGLCNHEIVSEIEDFKSQHEDWDINRIFKEVKKLYANT